MSRFGLISLALILACQMAAGLTGSATAAEQVVVPFTCEADPTGVYAIPSALQAYPIYGQRDAAPFTACDPRDANRCRTIMLHRFEFDCGGTRVAWPQFYAAISGVTTGRAIYEDNRLMVRVRPQPNRRFRERDFRSSARQRSFVIEMPDGYAPVRGTVARFVDRNGRNVATRRAPTAPAQAKTITDTRNPKPKETKKRAAAQPKRPRTSDNQVKITKPDRTAARETRSAQNEPAAKDKPGIAVHRVPKAKPNPDKASNKPKSASRIVPNILNAERRKTKAGDTDAQSKAPPNKPADVHLKKAAPKNADRKTNLTFGENLTKSAPEDQKQNRPVSQVNTTKKGGMTTPVRDNKTAVASKKIAPGNALRAQSPPSLFDTLAVLIVVVALMLTLLIAGPRLMRRPKHASVHADYEAARDHAKAFAMAANQLKQPELEDRATRSKPDVSKKEDQPDFRVLTVGVKQEALPAHAEVPIEPQLPGLHEVEKTGNKPAEDQPNNDTKESRSDKKGVMPVAAKLSSPRPQPKLQPLFDVAKPDPEDTALILPTTRQEALSALGVGSNAGRDVIARVVQDLKKSCRLEDAEDSYDKMHRQNRMEQIEAAWKILAGTTHAISTTDNKQTDQHV